MKKYWKAIILFSVFLSLFLLNQHFEWFNNFTNQEGIERFHRIIDENYWHAICIYTVITIVGCVAFALPGITFAVLAGILFGPWLGSLYCLIATTIGAMLSFVIARYFLKDSLKPLVLKNQAIRKFLFESSKENEVFLLLITRTLPIFPFNLQNFAYGITDISFWKYSIFTFLFLIPGVALFTIGTVGTIDSKDRFAYWGIAFAIAIFVTILGIILKKKLKKSVST